MSNSGVFDVNDIRYLMDYQQWSGVGTLELLETQVASSASALDFLILKEDIYDVHFLTFNNYQANTDNTIFNIGLYENGVEENASVYQLAIQGGRAGGTFSPYKSTAYNGGVMSIGSGIDNASGSSCNGYTYFYNLGDSSKYSFATFQCSYNYYDSAEFEMNFGSGVLPQTSVVDGLRIRPNGGTFSGDFSLYGIRYS